jgi:pimeloyl-ACP methyl ester carboxylesterase
VATFVLVHGSWQASWVWRTVVACLEESGHSALTLDLPGHGTDAGRASDVGFDDYVAAVGDLVHRCVEPPILVVHSWGGLAAGVGESWPDRLRAIVFVAAAVPSNGSSMMEVVGQYDPAVSATFVFSADRRLASLTEEGARAFLFNLAPASDVDDAIGRLTPEPVAPLEAPIVTTAERFGRVPSYYVETTADRAVHLALQRTIQARIGPSRVFTLRADHAPYFSAPRELATCLDDIAVHVETPAV